MNKNEQDMIRKIKEKSEQVPVPKALEPRQIEAKLAGKKKKMWTPTRIGGLAAACLVLIVGVMVYQNYFKMEDATRDDKIAGSDVTISDSTKVESAAEYKDVYAYLEKYKKDQERDSAYTSSWARSLNDIRVDESADSKVIAVCDGYVGGKWNDDDYGYGQRANTTAVTYDISDRENPKEVGRVSQSGYYNSSRIADGYLYLFSDYYVTLDGITAKNPKSYIPLVNDNLIEETDICLPSISKADMYSIITSVSLENPNETAHSKALLADGGNLYVSNDNIYFYENVWQYSGKDVTTIRKVSYESGKLTAGAQCKIDGYINDSFSIDEYDGYLRVVVTDGDTNSVYVLNQELKETGSIKGLAEDERVYSARFMGKAGYFVTFKETDPLFSVDLSDPKNPKIIGALKIPGFSDYLHPYGKNKLLGIGMNVDEKTMSTDGVKLTMFDISDPENVKEEQTYVIENVYYTDVSYDYKAALVDAEKNLIGFAADSEGGREYYTFSYDEKQGFTCTMHEEINGNNMRITRGIYIEDMLYVIQGNIIEAYSLKDFKKVDDIIL